MNKQEKRLRIALITALDAQDRRSWSGTFYYIAQALQKYCGDVSYIGPMQASREIFLGKITHVGAQLLCRKNYAFRHSRAVSKRYAHVARERIEQQPPFDVIFALSGATEIAYLDTDDMANTPIILVEDGNFAVLHEYHQSFSLLLNTSIHQLHDIQRRGIEKADQLLYSTNWAAQAAIEHYKADPRKVAVVPFGANLESPPTRDQALNRTPSRQCRLLFVGVDWERKGGDIAFETLLALEAMGIPTKLTICGCVPPKSFSHPHLSVIPFLNKNDPEQRQRLETLYLQSDFLLLPTRNECFGISFCEANAFGLPVVATSTGGVPEVVRYGENGFTLPYDARGNAYAEVISYVFRDQSLYTQLVVRSRNAFEERLNWDTWGRSTHSVLTAMLQRKKEQKNGPFYTPRPTLINQ